MPKGFNLIELLIVLVIIGILTAISLPIYSHHLIHEKRLEAEVMLNKIALALEKYFMINLSYKNATLETLGFPKKIAHNHYELVMNVDDNEFDLQAIPIGEQADKDKACGTLIINSQGIKRITGEGKLEDCW